MNTSSKFGLGWLAALAVLGLAACGLGGPIRVYVEPTYEQDRLQELLAGDPELFVVPHPGTEEVSLRVEAAPRESPQAPPRASIHARELGSGYEVFALAEFLPVRNSHGGRARWVSSFSSGLREDYVDEILRQVVLEAARQDHRDTQRTFTEVERALHSTTPAS